jgi:hypothetical protein
LIQPYNKVRAKPADGLYFQADLINGGCVFLLRYHESLYIPELFVILFSELMSNYRYPAPEIA